MADTLRHTDADVRRYLARDRQRRVLRSLHTEPLPHRPTLPLACTPGLWEHFAVVPPAFYTEEHGVAVITCPCGYVDPGIGEPPQMRVELGAMHSCEGCGRIYVMTRRLHCANPEDAPAFTHSHPFEQACLPPCPEYQ